MLYALIGHVKTTRFTGGYYYIRSKMEIIEGKLYFIKDEFIEKYNPKNII